jgi:hypothetical protein
MTIKMIGTLAEINGQAPASGVRLRKPARISSFAQSPGFPMPDQGRDR